MKESLRRSHGEWLFRRIRWPSPASELWTREDKEHLVATILPQARVDLPLAYIRRNSPFEIRASDCMSQSSGWPRKRWTAPTSTVKNHWCASEAYAEAGSRLFAKLGCLRIWAI